MIQFHTWSVSGIQLHYAEAPGPQPAIVIIHGLTGSHAEFLHLVPELSKVAHVYLLDMRGHGLSSHATDGYQVADYGRDVAAFLRQVVGQPVVLLGHSLGGLVAVWLAANMPELFRGVILEDPGFYILQMPRFGETWFYPYFIDLRDFLRQHHANSGSLADVEAYVGQALVEDGRTMLQVAGPEAVRERAVQLHQMDAATLDSAIDGTLLGSTEPDDLLAQIRCPVHLVAAPFALGGALDVPDVRRVVSQIPYCTHAVIDDASHDIHLAQPAAFIRQLKGFLAELREHV